MEDNLAHATELQDPLVGRVLSNRYRVLRRIGRGGMGVVYLAEHVLIHRKLAIKVLHPQLSSSVELIQRFHREARVAAAVGDEHVVDVTDMGRLDDGTYYLVLEYLDGLDLGSTIAAEGPLALARVIDIGVQLCQALAAVHGAGIVHRDLKPENIVLIRRRGRTDFVKILDFGICKVLDERPLTATGVALGTPRFMAPEQLEARREVDCRADVYAVGAILFFAMSGRNPFDCESLPQLLISVWQDPAPKLRDVCPGAPAELEHIITRALEKERARRFPDAQALGAELGALGRALGLSPPTGEHHWALASGVHDTCAALLPATPTSRAPASRSTRPRLRRRWAQTATAALIVIATAALFSGWVYWVGSSLLPTPRATTSRRPASADAAQPRHLQVTPAAPQGEPPAQTPAASPMPARPAEIEPSNAAPQSRIAPRSARRGVNFAQKPKAADTPEPALAAPMDRQTGAMPTAEHSLTVDESVAPPSPPPPPQLETPSPARPIVPLPGELKRVF